jgi:hypothetical protein
MQASNFESHVQFADWCAYIEIYNSEECPSACTALSNVTRSRYPIQVLWPTSLWTASMEYLYTSRWRMGAKTAQPLCWMWLHFLCVRHYTIKCTTTNNILWYSTGFANWSTRELCLSPITITRLHLTIESYLWFSVWQKHAGFKLSTKHPL